MKNKMIIKKFNIELKSVNRDEGILKAIISSGLPDRSNEIVDQESWKLENYRLNPVVMWGHDHSIPAIGQCLSLGLNDKRMLEAEMKFAVKESKFAKEIFDLYAGGFLRAFSVGFMVGTYEEKGDVIILRDNELIEFSAVNVPMDALALSKSLQKEIDLTNKSIEALKNARKAIDEIIENKPKNKLRYRKIINKAIRELIVSKKHND